MKFEPVHNYLSTGLLLWHCLMFSIKLALSVFVRSLRESQQRLTIYFGWISLFECLIWFSKDLRRISSNKGAVALFFASLFSGHCDLSNKILLAQADTRSHVLYMKVARSRRSSKTVVNNYTWWVWEGFLFSKMAGFTLFTRHWSLSAPYNTASECIFLWQSSQ